MKTYKIDEVAWAVYDFDELTYRENIIAYFEQSIDAQKFAGNVGGNIANFDKNPKLRVKRVVISHHYDIFENVADYWVSSANQKREAALAKLTREEQELLGLVLGSPK